jgi:hypothetical protein
MTRNPAIVFILAVFAAGFSLPAASQTTPPTLLEMGFFALLSR